jgi:four helix bundle protein
MFASYEEWEGQVPSVIKEDTLWRMGVYRLALFLADLVWHDTSKLARKPHMRSVADQLFRSGGGISAHIAEGYSRSSGKDQARFYEYGLGSSREARDWYFKSRHELGPRVTEHRISLLTRIIQQLLRIVPAARKRNIREERAEYTVEFDPTDPLLCNIPYA